MLFANLVTKTVLPEKGRQRHGLRCELCRRGSHLAAGVGRGEFYSLQSHLSRLEVGTGQVMRTEDMQIKHLPPFAILAQGLLLKHPRCLTSRKYPVALVKPRDQPAKASSLCKKIDWLTQSKICACGKSAAVAAATANTSIRPEGLRSPLSWVLPDLVLTPALWDNISVPCQL